MTRETIAPVRQYPRGVTVVRRSMRGAASAPETNSLADIEAWLLRGAARETEMLLVLESFIWRMVAAGGMGDIVEAQLEMPSRRKALRRRDHVLGRQQAHQV